MTAQERRAAANARRAAAEQAGERGGDAAYRSYRSEAPGIGCARRVPMKTSIKASVETKDGKELVHTEGYFTRYGVEYPMWDQYGEYEESVRSGAGRQTIASKPDVAFLVNHSGVTMARTTNGTLLLDERREGGWHDAWLNPKRTDVSDLVIALEDSSIDQMSFAFVIPDDGGWWSDDFMHFEILSYDINRGDVSAVNYGASPYTDISARTAEVLMDLDHLPMGALRAAEDRLVRRGLTRTDFARGGYVEAPRERIEVRERVEPTVIARGGTAKSVSRLNAFKVATAGRMVAYAQERGLPVSALPAVQLPWFEVRNAAGDEPEQSEAPDVATVYVYDEIGGSFGVEASAFALALDEITAPKIALRINSPGGSVFEGITIHSSLLHHPARVRSYVDGLAASAASVIAMSADPLEGEGEDEWGGVVMMPGGQMMIHDASARVDITPAEAQSWFTYLDRQSQNIAAMYAGRAGGTADEWRALMQEETWAFADEAVELRLADKVYERPMPIANTETAERMARTWDLGSRYRYAGRRAAPAPMRPGTVRTHPAPARPDEAPARHVVVADRADSESTERANGGPSATVVHDGDRQNVPLGRSIALIAAELDVAEHEA